MMTSNARKKDKKMLKLTFLLFLFCKQQYYEPVLPNRTETHQVLYVEKIFPAEVVSHFAVRSGPFGITFDQEYRYTPKSFYRIYFAEWKTMCGPPVHIDIKNDRLKFICQLLKEGDEIRVEYTHNYINDIIRTGF